MKWLKELENYNIAFQVYILQKEDTVFMLSSKNKNKIIYIADGLVQLLKIFTNKEQVCTALVYNGETIESKYKKKEKNYHYAVKAVEATVIIVMSLKKNCKRVNNRERKILKNSANQYRVAGEMVSILLHKNTRQRIIQLILIMASRFGCMQNKRIIVPIYLNHQTMARIIGSQRVTVSRIISHLKQQGIIENKDEYIAIFSLTKLIQV